MNTVTKATIAKTSPWFVCFKPNEQARLRLFCFPYAGGGAIVYRKWYQSLPADIEIWAAQLPGRGNRLNEKPFTSLSTLVEAVARELAPYLDKPFAFFGHSLGAMISFELAHKLRIEYGVEPAHLFISGCRAPQFTDMLCRTYDLPEAEFIEELRRLNGTPKEVLEHPELMQLILSPLRADFQLCQTHVHSAKPRLSSPTTVLAGLEDKEITPEHLEAWRDHTSTSFSLRMLPGDHFFLHTSESFLLRIISRCLRQIVGRLDEG